MNALLAALSLVLGVAISVAVTGGAAAVVFCAAVALVTGFAISHVKDHGRYLLRLFVMALLVRVVIGTAIYVSDSLEFFGGDALTYDILGYILYDSWHGNPVVRRLVEEWARGGGGWGMIYLVASIYTLTGRNMLAVQFFNSVIGAATAPIIFLCARHIFHNVRVASIAGLFVAFYPSLVLWSSQGLKDGPIVFLLALSMLATLKLGERFSYRDVVLLGCALLGLLTLRFYVFYMVLAAIAGSFIIGMRPVSSNNLVRQFVMVAGIGLLLTYVMVLRGANQQMEKFNLETVQISRADLAGAQSGFGRDIDVSTTSGALTAIPVGMVYLLFAPFPWQLANLRQGITLPEMLVWWGSFPLLVIGVYFTVKYRLRQALPILIFTTMLTLAYSIFQGNVGTAYRQRAQILVFYFIFVAVGFVLVREKREDKIRQGLMIKQAALETARSTRARERYEQWKRGHEKQLEDVARDITKRIDF
jgi:hypothetical protein